MKIYIKIIDDSDGSDVSIIAANSLEEAKKIVTKCNTEEEFVNQEVEERNPKNYRDQYKTEDGFKQALKQFDEFNRNKYAVKARDQYRIATESIQDTNIEIQVDNPQVLWVRDLKYDV